MKMILGAAIAALTLTACDSDPPAAEEVESSEYGADWPFPAFPEAQLRCETKSFGGVERPLVTIQLGEKIYGLNGAAMGVGGFPDSRTRMARHPEWGSYELGATSDLIKRGLELCSGN